MQLARLATAVGPLRRVTAAIAARLTGTRAFERLGYARLSDYARERPGLSARQIQELARVHRALTGLPVLERALVENTLPWSKVRLVARVATPAEEGAWIACARALPTRQLEHEVRGCGVDDEPDEAPVRRVAVRCTPAVCEKWSLAREVARRVAGESLRDAEVLELVAAEAFSAVSIDPAFAAWPAPASERPAETGGMAGCGSDVAHGSVELERAREPGPLGPALAFSRRVPRALERLAAGLEEADAFALDRRLRRAIRLEQTLDSEIAPLLRVVRNTGRGREGCGAYRPLAAYARDELGMSARKARALLRLERAGDVCPELREAYRSGRLSWVKAQCLLPLLMLDVAGGWRRVWVAWAARVTVRRLADDVERALLLQAGHHPAWQRCQFHPERAQDPIPASERQLCAPDIDADATRELVWRVPRDVAVLFRAVSQTWRARHGLARFATEGVVFEELLDHALRTWLQRAPGARRPDPVIERDGYRCVVPGCSSRRNLHDHHIRFRSGGGSDALENRVTLCAFHHLRGVHAGRLRIRGRAPHALVFELPLARYVSGDIEIKAASRRPAASTGCRPA